MEKEFLLPDDFKLQVNGINLFRVEAKDSNDMADVAIFDGIYTLVYDVGGFAIVKILSGKRLCTIQTDKLELSIADFKRVPCPPNYWDKFTIYKLTAVSNIVNLLVGFSGYERSFNKELL
jgi:hypothetical protein